MNLRKTKTTTNGKKEKIMLNDVELNYLEQYVCCKTNNEDEVNGRVTCSWIKYRVHKEVLKCNYDINTKNNHYG